MAGAGGGFHWMSLKQRISSETEENLGRIMREVDDHCLRRAPARLPFASSAARRLLLLPAIGSWSCADGEKQAWVGKGLKAKGLMKG
jgi:hypothetical protein